MFAPKYGRRRAPISPVVCQTGLFGPLFQKQANIDIGLFSKTSNINIEIHFLHFFLKFLANIDIGHVQKLQSILIFGMPRIIEIFHIAAV